MKFINSRLKNAIAEKAKRSAKPQQTGMVQHTGMPGGSPVASEPDALPITEQDARIAERNQQLQQSGVLIGDKAGTMKADELNSLVMRRQWDQFEQNDIPYILRYADTVTSGVHQQRAVDQAVTGVNRGYEIAEKSQQMRDTGLGVGLSDAVKADRASDMQRNKTASLIDAENNARLAGKDRENALLAGSHMPAVK